MLDTAGALTWYQGSKKDSRSLADDADILAAMDRGNGIYVPFYVRSETGKTRMGLILVRWDLSEGGILSIEADYEWPTAGSNHHVLAVQDTAIPSRWMFLPP